MIVKKESAVATPVTPTHPVRYKGGDIMLQRETKKNNPIQNNRANNIQPLAGKINSEGTLQFDFDFNECGFWLLGGFGGSSSSDISSETDASVYEHTFTVANSLPSFTVQQQKGDISDTSNGRQNYEVSRAFGVMVDKFTLSAGDEEVQLEIDAKAHGIFQRGLMIADAAAGSSVAIKLDQVEGLTTSDSVNIYDTDGSETDAIASMSATAKTVTIATLGLTYEYAKRGKVELVPITPSYSIEPRVPMFHQVNFQFGEDLTAAAAAAETNIEDWSIEHDNQLDVRFGSIRQTPSKVTAKGYGTTLKFTKYWETVTERDNYLALTEQAVIVTISDGAVISATDTDLARYQLKIEMPRVTIDSYELATETDGVYAAVIECGVYYDASEGYAIRAKLQNGLAGTAYTA